MKHILSFSLATRAIVHNNINVRTFAILEYKSPFQRNLTIHMQCNSGQGPFSRKFRKLCGPEKSFVKLRPAYSVKLVFLHVVKGIKIKITTKIRASRRLRFEDTTKIVTRNATEKSSGPWRNVPQEPNTVPIMPAQSRAHNQRFLFLDLCFCY